MVLLVHQLDQTVKIILVRPGICIVKIFQKKQNILNQKIISYLKIADITYTYIPRYFRGNSCLFKQSKQRLNINQFEMGITVWVLLITHYQ